MSTLSYSQISTFELCPRKWAWGQLSREWEPKRKPQNDGDELHSINEAWVRFGLKPRGDTPMSKLALLGLDHLPAKFDDPLVEHEEVIRYGRHELKVKPDLCWLAPCGPVVMDFKTVDNFNWVPTPAKLRIGLQANIYALYACELFKMREATCMWLYYRRPAEGEEPKPEDVKDPVEVVIEREDALRVLRGHQQLMDAMAALKQAPIPALEVTGNAPTGCKAYGGCWYRPKCFPERYMYDPNDKTKVLDRQALLALGSVP